ncbi:MAG: dehydrogenase [Rhodopirellula sp.]|nr:dehydrogenase [Rhodopirellula sp.]
MRIIRFCFLLFLFSFVGLLSAQAEDWPQWRGPTSDGVWHEQGILTKFDSPEIPLKWKVPVGSGYSAPTVASGRVYLTDRVLEPVPSERVLCFDEQTGETIWEFSYECNYEIGYTAGPRAAVTVRDGKAYALGAMGNFLCFDAKAGNILWQHDLNAEYDIQMPIWGIAGSPLVVEETVIVQLGGKQATVAGFDIETGKARWTALKDRACYASPILIKQADKQVVVVWTGDSVAGLAPQTGEVYWRHIWPPSRMPIGVATPVTSGNQLFLTSFYDGCLLLDLAQDKPGVKKVWQRTGEDERHTDGIHSIISTPIVLDKHVYGVDSYGELRCLDLKTGDRVWEDQTATPRARWSTIHFVKNGENIWMFNERGELVIGRLSPKGLTEISRAKLIDPTEDQLRQRGGVCWSHPAYANKHVFARSDKYLVCASLAAKK